MKMGFSLLAIVALIASSSALVISRSTGRTRTPPGFHLDSAVADDGGNVVQVADADVVPYASMVESTSQKHSLAQLAELNKAGSIKDDNENRMQSNNTDANGWEVVRVVEADVVNDTSKEGANSSNAVNDKAADVSKESGGNLGTVQTQTVSAEAKANNSKSEQEDNDDNDEDDAGGDIMQGPTKPRASVVQMQAPKINITAVVTAAQDARDVADSVIRDKDMQAKRSLRSSQNKSEGQVVGKTKDTESDMHMDQSKTKSEVHLEQSKKDNAKEETISVTIPKPLPATQVVENTKVTEAPPDQNPVDADPDTQNVKNTDNAAAPQNTKVTEAPPEQMPVDADPETQNVEHDDNMEAAEQMSAHPDPEAQYVEIPEATEAPPAVVTQENVKKDCTPSDEGYEFNENSDCE